MANIQSITRKYHIPNRNIEVEVKLKVNVEFPGPNYHMIDVRAPENTFSSSVIDFIDLGAVTDGIHHGTSKTGYDLKDSDLFIEVLELRFTPNLENFEEEELLHIRDKLVNLSSDLISPILKRWKSQNVPGEDIDES